MRNALFMRNVLFMRYGYFYAQLFITVFAML